MKTTAHGFEYTEPWGTRLADGSWHQGYVLARATRGHVRYRAVMGGPGPDGTVCYDPPLAESDWLPTKQKALNWLRHQAEVAR